MKILSQIPFMWNSHAIHAFPYPALNSHLQQTPRKCWSFSLSIFSLLSFPTILSQFRIFPSAPRKVFYKGHQLLLRTNSYFLDSSTGDSWSHTAPSYSLHSVSEIYNPLFLSFYSIFPGSSSVCLSGSSSPVWPLNLNCLVFSYLSALLILSGYKIKHY
jgi:hypothetical protein